MTVFDDALGRLFAEPAWAEAGTYRAPPAAPVPVTVYRARHDPLIALDAVQVRAPGWEAHVSQAEVPVRPRPGTDTLTISSVVYAIRDVEEDAERTEWRLAILEA
jgi:hypothetical protein